MMSGGGSHLRIQRRVLPPRCRHPPSGRRGMPAGCWPLRTSGVDNTGPHRGLRSVIRLVGPDPGDLIVGITWILFVDETVMERARGTRLSRSVGPPSGQCLMWWMCTQRVRSQPGNTQPRSCSRTLRRSHGGTERETRPMPTVGPWASSTAAGHRCMAVRLPRARVVDLGEEHQTIGPCRTLRGAQIVHRGDLVKQGLSLRLGICLHQHDQLLRARHRRCFHKVSEGCSKKRPGRSDIRNPAGCPGG